MSRISEIDQQINANRKELLKRTGTKPRSAAGWQRAWDQHPDLAALDMQLFLQRGLAQEERDEKAHKDFMRQKRSARAKKRSAPPAKPFFQKIQEAAYDGQNGSAEYALDRLALIQALATTAIERCEAVS